jgi:trigger factor
MALKSITNTEPNIHELILEITPEAFEEAIENVYQKEKKNIQVPGFRKGKASRKMVESTYGEGVFYEQALGRLADTELWKAIEDADLQLVARPSLDVESISKKDGVVLKATCTTKPEVVIKEYKGIKAPKHVKTVSDEEVESRIKMILEKNSRLVSVDDRPCKVGDEVVMDFEGFKDGEAFEGGKAVEYGLRLGSGQFIPGFEDQVVGHSVGDEFEINVTFPEDYGVDELASQPVVFKIKIHEITSMELPELDDEFVQDTCEFDTVAEFKADVKAQLEEQADKQADIAFEKYVFDSVINNVDADIPNCMIEGRIDMLASDFERSLGSNMTLDNYLKYTNMTMGEFRASFDERAEKEVVLRLALEKIAELENITVSDEEVEESLQEMCTANNYNIDRVRNTIPMEAYKLDLVATKAADFIKDNAVVDNTMPPMPGMEDDSDYSDEE